jgi:hypothetical protein
MIEEEGMRDNSDVRLLVGGLSKALASFGFSM